MTTTCHKCGHEIRMAEFPFCPHGASHHFSITRDEIPGGLLVPHAICHPDGTPKRYDSMADIRRALAAKGYCIEGETPKIGKREI